jgi:3-methyladenine DNA glycosylase AlkD
MVSVNEVIRKLGQSAEPGNRDGMAKYGMSVERRLGVAVPELRKMAKGIGLDHSLALGLWDTGIAEAMIVASMIADPDRLTEEQMEAWVRDIDSWDVCDQVCMNLFEKSPKAREKIEEWAQHQEEFVRRAAYALIACLAWHDKAAGDAAFLDLLPIIEAGATDERNYVKKAVSWALRNIGKRNRNLHSAAIKFAQRLRNADSRSANWIASRTVRDLSSEATRRRLEKEGA